MPNTLQSLARKVLPLAVRRRIIFYTRWPPVGLVRFGSLRRLKPISSKWGMDRGKPIDRYYIERFLAAKSSYIQGRVLEIGDDTYTRMFGGNRVIQSEVLHVAERNSKVTIIADLTSADGIPPASFDCIILTQTLQTIFDLPAVIRTIYRILKPGGVALVTIPGISRISRYDMDRWGYYWSFTTKSAQRLFEAVFPGSNVQVQAHGNVLTAIAFLQGLATEELRLEELNYVDPDYELLITVTASKA
ncbi:MAG TPA: methyltransferase domain-containing protein [Anaerolineales bacterium]|nr:methyltransferase domain-containing protein [Anaerolineales bacterium]